MTERKELPSDEVKETNEPNLVQKIATAIDDTKGVKQDGYNGIQHYYYTTDKQVAKVSRSLTKHGVIVIPELSIADKWSEKTRKGSQNNFVQVNGKYTITDGNQSFTARCDGIGTDTLDKAVYKAETGAKKNFFMQLMLLSSDEDTDDDHGKGIDQQQSNQNYPQNNQYQSNSYQKNSSNNVSEGQIKFIRSLFEQYTKNTDSDAKEVLKVTILKKYDKHKLSEITKQEASELISGMQQAVKNK